ncbi:MAG TPA: cobalamin ABC transporter ATP-binding protein [Acidobacteria bacterium]|nr:cobalamin ABC transporter ATP-binding protein [Acidobacteriota bacterium]HAK56518.1 cobalamin ABC transporter ATP-binding protein [Acidobacteriota bacterium]
MNSRSSRGSRTCSTAPTRQPSDSLRWDAAQSSECALLQATDVRFAYDRQPVLHEVSFDLVAGGVLGILGPNGSGKTTLLRLLGGLLRPQSGRIALDGSDLREIPHATLAQRMAIVPQETQLAFDYSVLEIALMGRYPHLRAFEVEGPEDIALARAALAETGTAELEDRSFMTLSGGEKQRVVIASALSQFGRRAVDAADTSDGQAEVLLLDEPTASLDLGYQLDVTATLRRLNTERSTSMVISTHDLNFAAALCDRVVLLRQGRVLAAGPIGDVLRPDTVRALYDVDAAVERHEAAGHLTVVPLTRRGDAAPGGRAGR